MDINNFDIFRKGNKCPLQVMHLVIYFAWDINYDVTVTFVTLVSFDSVCCMCGEPSSSR